MQWSTVRAILDIGHSLGVDKGPYGHTLSSPAAECGELAPSVFLEFTLAIGSDDLIFIPQVTNSRISRSSFLERRITLNNKALSIHGDIFGFDHSRIDSGPQSSREVICIARAC